jgi:hypothetical protein
VPPSDQFPAPARSNATGDSPLSRTVSLPAGLNLAPPATTPATPTSLNVFPGQPQLQASPAVQFQPLGFTVAQVRLVAKSHIVADVATKTRTYLADYQFLQFGYRLKLSLESSDASATPEAATAGCESAARAFLTDHQLASPWSLSLRHQANGCRSVAFGEVSLDGYILVGGHAVVTFDRQGTITAVDIQWVNAPQGTAVRSISLPDALVAIATGHGLADTTAPLSMPSSGAKISVAQTTIIYVPVGADGGIYWEPVWRVAGSNADGSSFLAYVSAIDSHFLR